MLFHIDNADYYNSLVDLKNEERLFDFNDITKKQLHKIWHMEHVPDSCIAELFNVSKSCVTNKRKKMNLSMRQCIIEDFIEEIHKFDGIGQVEQAINFFNKEVNTHERN